MKAFGTVEALEDIALRAHDEEAARDEISAIDGIGPTVTEALIKFFNEMHNRDMWRDMLSEIAPEPYIVEQSESPISGKTIVFTGKFETMSRDEAKARVRLPPRPICWLPGPVPEQSSKRRSNSALK